jgi:hypothetical protein
VERPELAGFLRGQQRQGSADADEDVITDARLRHEEARDDRGRAVDVDVELVGPDGDDASRLRQAHHEAADRTSRSIAVAPAEAP